MSLPEVGVFNLKDYEYHLCVRDNGEVWFEINDEGVFNGPAKFVIVSAQNGFHIRSVYNNKYLVKEETSNNINASAIDLVDVTTDPNCTLFTPEKADDESVWLKHVQSGKYLDNSSTPPPEQPFRAVVLNEPNKPKAILIAVDMTSLIKLPKTIVLKADNGKYLGNFTPNVRPFVPQLFKGTDRNDKATWFVTSYSRLGQLRFSPVAYSSQSCTSLGSPTYMIGVYVYNTNTLDNSVIDDRDFEIVQVNENSVALTHQGTFCKRQLFPEYDNADYFVANASSAVTEAILQVDEPILKRTVTVEYRLSDAIIYDLSPKSWVSQATRNDTDEDVVTTLGVSYTKTKSYTVTASASLTTTVTTKFQGGIPLIAEGEVEVSAAVTYEGSFGHTWDDSQDDNYSVQVTVPPHSKRAARVIAMEGKCDVPFAYTQIDVLADNTTVKKILNDGVFKGLNGYDFEGQVYDPDNPPVVLARFPIKL